MGPKANYFWPRAHQTTSRHTRKLQNLSNAYNSKTAKYVEDSQIVKKENSETTRAEQSLGPTLPDLFDGAIIGKHFQSKMKDPERVKKLYRTTWSNDFITFKEKNHYFYSFYFGFVWP